MAFVRLETAFKRFIGPLCMERLQLMMSDKPAILLGGDQLTGKSTMSRKLASYFPDGRIYSVGTMFREQAALIGVSVPEYSRLLLAQLQNPNSERRFDVDLDFRTCELIAGGGGINSTTYNVIEGRQPAVMGLFLNEKFGKKNTFRIYLTCSPRERAVRFIDREFGRKFFEIADKSLPLIHDAYKDFSGVGKLISQLNISDCEKIATTFIDNQRRDLDDRERYIDLYGMDYRDMKHYNIVVDTTGKSSEENFNVALSQIKSHSPVLWNTLNKQV